MFFDSEKICSHTLYFFLIIMKSLQLRGRRQIAESRKYCLVRVITFFSVCFLYFFLFLTGWDFGEIPYKYFPLEGCSILSQMLGLYLLPYHEQTNNSNITKL